MLIIALVLAVVGLVALVFAVVTSNELVAWVCIGASVLGVVLLIIDALRERPRTVTPKRRRAARGRRQPMARTPSTTPKKPADELPTQADDRIGGYRRRRHGAASAERRALSRASKRPAAWWRPAAHGPRHR